MRYVLFLGLAFFVAAESGCSKNAMNLQGQVDRMTENQQAVKNQLQQYQARISTLDVDHKELNTYLAQSQQQAKLLQEQLDAVRAQLKDTNQQLAAAQKSRAESDRRVKAMTASLERRGSITIEPNSSIKRSLPMINLPNFQTTRVDNVIRVVVPADQLFENNVARLRPGADRLLNQLSAELRRLYPHQIIGIEGHTDQRPSLSSYRNSHELSVAWAVATYDAMVHYAGMPSEQLFVVGYGQNRPKFSNGTNGVEPRNRRVEFVIYPEMFGR
ncbi:MAG: OmpA family protein [Planctomycetia bacterium]